MILPERVHDSYQYKAMIEARRFRLWSPESPTLYDVDVTLGEDHVTSYAAMRSIGVGEDEDC